MMNLEKQKKILTWTVIILVSINLIVLGLLFTNTYSDNDYSQEDKSSERYLFQKGETQNRPGMRIFDQIDFNDAQREQLKNSMSEHRQRIDLYTDSIRSIRGRMMDAITAEPPDTTIILRH